MHYYGILLIRLLVLVVLNLSLLGFYRWNLIVKMCISALNLHGDKNPENRKKYLEFKNKPNGIIVFHHCTFYDHYLFYNELEETLRPIVARKTCFWPFTNLFKKIGGIIFDKGSNTAQIIQEEVKNRKENEPFIGLAPSAGYSNNDDQNKLEPFKLGAFYPLTPVLPVLLKFDPYDNWKVGESLPQCFIKTVCSPQKRLYTVKILDEIKPLPEDTPESFSLRVKEYMEEGMRNLDVKKENQFYLENLTYEGSPILLSTSHLFLISSLVAFYFKLYPIAILQLIIYITSIFYHYKGDTHFGYLDTVSNMIVGFILIIFCFIHKSWISIIITKIVFIIYCIKQFMLSYWKIHFDEDLDVTHFLMVHIPCFVALMVLNYIAYQRKINKSS